MSELWLNKNGEPLEFQRGDFVHVDFDDVIGPEDAVQLTATYRRPRNRWFKAIEKNRPETPWRFNQDCIVQKCVPGCDLCGGA
jgi:hypothetical protein